jgi:alpha,alpha-trehalose phosphorylase
MLHRERVIPPEYIYPVDPWRLVEKEFYAAAIPTAESIFAVSNGYLGMRGNFEEDEPCHESGVYINGFHETWPIVYGESAHGFAKVGQTMIGVPDAKVIRLYVDDEPFYLPTAELKSFERALDMKRGCLTRELLWETPAGKLVRIRSKRMVSFTHRHLAVMHYEVTILNAEAPVVIASHAVNRKDEQTGDVDPRKARGFKERALVPDYFKDEGERLFLGFRTQNSGMSLGLGVDHQVETECAYDVASKHGQEDGQVVYSIAAKPEKPFSLTKFAAYHTSRRSRAGELCERAGRILARVKKIGHKPLFADQEAYMVDFWRRSDVRIETAQGVAQKSTEELQQAIRFNLFHLGQATGRAEGAGIPAKGLTGRTYEGHYFWDTEIYMLPFLLYTAPRIARNLLEFRYSMLDAARRRAREVNQKGALFPWRTISGEEASAYYAAGTAQYHINADIAYAVKKYVDVTGDRRFLWEKGAEILVETARLWDDLGFYSTAKGGKFCLNAVTGPDEYNAVVDNNAYTNLMARENLRYAAETVRRMRDEAPDWYAVLVDRTGLDHFEPAAWERAVEMMYIPRDEERGILLQDDDFLNKEPWDFAGTPLENYPLLLNYHPLVIYRHQVIKQADVVLAQFLLNDLFTLEEKTRNFEFYDPLTTGDSSLSTGIQSIMALETGDLKKGVEYGRYAMLMDLADVGGNVSDGCHIASMGACWMVLAYGLAGMRDRNGMISFHPVRLHGMEKLSFPLRIRGCELFVEIDGCTVVYTLRSGEELTIRHEEQVVRLTAQEPAMELPLTGHESCGLAD